jgi:hypothetical protein
LQKSEEIYEKLDDLEPFFCSLDLQYGQKATDADGRIGVGRPKEQFIARETDSAGSFCKYQYDKQGKWETNRSVNSERWLSRTKETTNTV